MPVNRKLIDNLSQQIITGKKNILNMNDSEHSHLLSLLTDSAGSNEALSISCLAISPLVPELNTTHLTPYWLDETTPFESPIWRLNLGSKPKIVDFNVRLDDGQLLTSDKHCKLLYSFKVWICSQGNPYLNGGKFARIITISQRIERVINLINALLINSKKIQLSSFHLSAISENLVQAILVNYAESGSENGLYYFHKKASDYLKKSSQDISDAELYEFEKKFPFVARVVDSNDKKLSITEKERRKACCYLFKQNAYSLNMTSKGFPTSKYFRKLYKNTLCIDSLNFCRLDELAIVEPETINEYKAVPVKETSSARTKKSIQVYIVAFRSLSIVNKFEAASKVDVSVFKDITASRINENIILREVGRYNTLPAEVVFKAIRDSFEFLIQYCDDILEGVFNVVANKPIKNLSSEYLTDYKQNGFLAFLPQSLIELGVEQWRVPNDIPDRFKQRRENKGFHDLFKVFNGALSNLIGSTMARREAELVDLDYSNCLVPCDRDPQLNKDIEFSLKFYNRKSGVGGENAKRELLTKPILNSVAVFVYKMQMFNKKLIEEKLILPKDAGIFLSFNEKSMRLSRLPHGVNFLNIDAFCDYFETLVIHQAYVEPRRFYIRQHQLRRFFAMLFFWSKGYDGLDTLRSFLGHTDYEHIYRYVTEGTPGIVLSGIKAKTLLNEKIRGKIENIELLDSVIAQSVSESPLRIASISDCLFDYEDSDVSTNPSIPLLKKQVEQEMIIIDLLNQGAIDLQPNFFTVTTDDGCVSHDFNLVLKVFHN